MLCCVGLIGGMSVGQYLGGHWTFTAPAVGFGLGFYGDMKLMRGMHGGNSPDSHQKSKMPCCPSLSKKEEKEKPLLQDGAKDAINVRSDSG